MEDLEEIFKLCKELGITQIGQLKAIRKPNMSVLECLQDIRNRRENYFYDYNMKKAFDKMDYFICEICGGLYQKKYEGTEPNTCEACMPRDLRENIAEFKRFRFE